MNAEHSLPVEAEAKVQQSSFVRLLKKRRWFLLLVAVPTMLAAIYYGLFASDIYISESRFVIKSPDQKRSQVSSLANLIQTTGLSGGQEQTNEVLSFVMSRDALKSLESTAGIRKRFAEGDTDFLSRFPEPWRQDTFENLYKYYGKMVDARLDSNTGMAVITVKAFTAHDAYAINQELLDLSEGLVNRLNERAHSKGIAEAENQVELATVRASEARVALAQYRNAQELIDPAGQAVGALEISNSLIAQRAGLQAQLDQMARVAPNHPSIPAMRSRISAISDQIASQDSKVVGSDNGIASKLGGYENLLVEQEFATQSVNAANANLVQARAEAQRQQFYLERVVDPNEPDMPLLPRRLINILIVAAAAVFLYFIGWMFMVGILEHSSEN